MKYLLLLQTHLYSGHQILYDSLADNPRVKMHSSDINFSDPAIVNEIFKLPSKLNNFCIYGYCNLFNFNIQHKGFYKNSKFIYFVRNGKETLIECLKNKSSINIYDYYSFRLRRMYEMYREIGGVFITPDSSQEDFNKLKKYLNLLEPVCFNKKEKIDYTFKKKEKYILSKMEECYEKYYYKFNQSTITSESPD